jgi:hypothetical protein
MMDTATQRDGLQESMDALNAAIDARLDEIASLKNNGHLFWDAAWDMVAELMGQTDWKVDDKDQSAYAMKMRRFLTASDALRTTLGGNQ